MTREEAIQILRTRIVPTMNWQEIHEALDMAIEALSAEPNCKDCKKRNNTTFFMNDEEVYDMAIEALKGGDAEILNEDFRPKYMQSSPSNGADLISRADVLEGLKHSTAYLHDDIYAIVNRIPSAETTGALDDAIAKYVADGLMELPSAEAVQGEWIRCEGGIKDFGGTTVGYSYWYECDQCGSKPPKDTWGHEWHSNFCPNCGARMKGGDSE